jgi:glycosyltransferase involved in cell wall biosynthesis
MSTTEIKKTLYLCYFGVREPLVQTQVLPYLRQLVAGGIAVTLLSFEPNPKENWTGEQIESERAKLAADGIEWHFLTYHKRPSAPATLFDALCGARFAWKLARRENIDVLHGRSIVATMMGVIAKKFSRRKPKVLFDIRGFFPEEYAEGGSWKMNGWLFRSVKRAESWLMKESDAFVILTEKARDILFPGSRETGFDKHGRPVEVIPCCVDLKRFESANADSRRRIRQKLGVENRRVIVYVGSFGFTWYMPDALADLIGEAKKREPETFAMILSQTPLELIKPLLEARGFTEKDYFVQKVSPKEIPLYLSAADAAVSFIKPCFSKLATSATKNAEYLAAGLPMITNSGVGDTAEMTLEDGVGIIIDEFNRESYEQALTKLENLIRETPNLAERCRESARKRFGLENVGGKRYLNVYRKLERSSGRKELSR